MAYNGETVNKKKLISEPAKHIDKNLDHVFTWKVLSLGPKDKSIRKNLEAILSLCQSHR